MPRHCLPLTIIFLALFLSACDTTQEAGPPAEWESMGTERWWHPDVDTSLAFRNMEGFEELGLSDREDGLREESAVVRNVQRRFLALYRNHPELVDSLFAELALPMIEREAEPGQLDEERDALVSQINRRLHRVFFPVQPRQEDREPIVMPDSLREMGVSGTISLQIYVGQDGRTRAIKKLEGVHDAMDGIVMSNYAGRTWQPAHLDGDPIAAWTRARINIGD